MADARRRTLKCPHCGAPLPPESVTDAVLCAFCGVASTPLAEPDPAAGAPAGGPSRAARETVEAAEAQCPRCELPLFEGRAGEIAMLGCGRCGGIWLDNAAAQRALATMDEAVVALADQASRQAAFTVDVGRTISCPTCRRPMGRTRAPKSGIYIDVCGAHGTWFDRYELGVVMEALRPKAAPQATTYDGPTPDFREGANPELKQLASVFGYGVMGILGAAAGAGIAVAGAAPQKR